MENKNEPKIIPRYLLEYYIDKDKGIIGIWEAGIHSINISGLHRFWFNEIKDAKCGESNYEFNIDTSNFLSLSLCDGQDVPEFDIECTGNRKLKFDTMLVGWSSSGIIDNKCDISFLHQGHRHHWCRVKDFRRMTFIPPEDKKEVELDRDSDISHYDLQMLYGTECKELKTAQEEIKRLKLIYNGEKHYEVLYEGLRGKFATAQEEIKETMNGLAGLPVEPLDKPATNWGSLKSEY